MSELAGIMSLASKQLVASIEEARFAVEHRGEKGSAVESAVRKFFRDHLPSSIGVTHGEVIDRYGHASTQLDVILYDEARTPILYQDREAGVRIVPAEGVIAAVEVKTALKNDQVPKLGEAARKLKQLDRSSYYIPQEPIIQNFSYAYGREYPVLPPLYFILAFDGPKLENLALQMALNNLACDISEGIDMACVLNRGVVVNGKSDGQGGVKALCAISDAETQMVPLKTDHSLLMFYILASRYLLQAEKPPISIQNYLPSDFDFHAAQ